MAKKNERLASLTLFEAKSLIKKNQEISIRRQCELLGVNRSSIYYEPATESPLNLKLMKLIDKLYLDYPFLGQRRMMYFIRKEGYSVNRKRVRRLMSKMGIEAVYPKKRTTKPSDSQKPYPYLLRGLQISEPDHVWCTDITYIPMLKGWVYLVAIMDWASRYILSWELSNSMDVYFCICALESALSQSSPEIFNSDQGSQFMSIKFQQLLTNNGVKISMDGRGRWMDNVFIERLWRSLKYEEVYLNEYRTVTEARQGINRWINFYNNIRPHSALNNLTPVEFYRAGKER